MAGRSALDRLAIAGVVIAGVVEAAQAALANAPAVQRAYPVLKLDGLWNYVPVAFISAATLLWLIDQGLRILRPSYARARAIPVQDEIPLPTTSQRKPLPWKAIWGIGSTVALVGLLAWSLPGIVSCSNAEAARQEHELATKPEMKFAPILRGSVTLAFVKQVLQSQDAVTAEKTLNAYLGTTMRVAGIVHLNDGGANLSRTVTITDPKITPQVYLIFDQHQNDANFYKIGQHIAAECKIERLDASGIGLDGCALISDEAWTGKPASN